MKIARVEAFRIANVPVDPPPFRTGPSTSSAVIVKVETDDGVTGWSLGGTFAHEIVVDLINKYVGPAIIGEDPIRTDAIWSRLTNPPRMSEAKVGAKILGRVFTSAMSSIDIALWDIKGRSVGLPVHHLLGGAADKCAVYITVGARGPMYSAEELAAEAKWLVEQGNRHIKVPVGHQLDPNEPPGRRSFAPDPYDDAVRMRAVRDAIGPDVKLSMDATSRFNAPEAIRLCQLVEELNIGFFEEPVINNDPRMMVALKAQTSIPIAAPENHMYSTLDLLQADAIDIVHPNVNVDGGFTGALRIAALARAFNKPLGHGNGQGPHNAVFQAGIADGALVEYHYGHWKTYTAIFQDVPQPVEGYAHIPSTPGVGFEPKAGLIEAYRVRD